MPASPHSIRVALDEPSIYLEIEVESSKMLCDLAEATVHAFDFDHAFGFYSSVMRSQPKTNWSLTWVRGRVPRA